VALLSQGRQGELAATPIVQSTFVRK